MAFIVSVSTFPPTAGWYSQPVPRPLFLRALGLGQYAFGFLLPSEYFFHIHAGFLHHLGIEVRVDIGRSLIVRMAQYLHGNQRFHTRLEQQRSEIVPEVMRRQGRLQALYDVVLPLGACLDLPLFHTMSIFHQAEPDALEAALRPRLAGFRMEYILLRETAHLRQHGAKLSGNRYIAVGSIGFQIAVTGRGAAEIDVALDVYQILVEIKVAPLQAQRLAATKAEVVQYCQIQAMLVVFHRFQYILGFLIGQSATFGLFLRLRADQRNARIALNDALGVCVCE